MNLHNNAVVFQDVCKIYGLYTSKWQMVKEALGFKNSKCPQQFHALSNINLTIKKGERIGLVGRNGAGKSTLLKLITGNFKQTSGSIVVNGNVQALMNTGIGFHPEFTGLQNIKASLLYNGLSKKQFNIAVEDVIDFVELDDFLDQPLKVYSLGMQSRLFFAVATAIQPEILIIDEVLGAGDAYFSAKSADRMKKLTGSGCTLILVSHSTQQVLQFCEHAYWLESGRIVMYGHTIDVIKGYEAYTKNLEIELTEKTHKSEFFDQSIIQSKWLREKLLKKVLAQHTTITDQYEDKEVRENNKSYNLIGLSRWPSMEAGLKVVNIALLDSYAKQITEVKTNQQLNIEISVQAEYEHNFDIYFNVVLFTEDGRWLTRNCSEKIQVNIKSDQIYKVTMRYDKVLLGHGKYIFSVAIFKNMDLFDLKNARYYDLLSRSFQFKVEGIYQDDETIFHHPVRWITNNKKNCLHEK